jgi:hypothetical protein
MFLLATGRSPEVENLLRYGHFSDVDGWVVEMGSDAGGSSYVFMSKS